MSNPHDFAIAMAAVFIGVPLVIAMAAGLIATGLLVVVALSGDRS